MSDHVEGSETGRRRMLALAKELGLDPSEIKQDEGIRAEWSSSDDDVVVTWTGRRAIPRSEWNPMVERMNREERMNG